MVSFGDENAAEHSSKQRIRKSITWDDETISEHDKERGTRMKIIEANTPFCYLSEGDESDDDAPDESHVAYEDLAQQVIDRLCEIKQSADKSDRFAEMRKKHYRNEYLKGVLKNRYDDVSDDECCGEDEDSSKEVFLNIKCTAPAVIR
ncbi:Protein phosphatase inhibitor 2 (IPP-2) family protein [Babesia bovis T2Bo]|uniref:Protein phosphatase inhibitor 2 n=1 Tax=Babesia bovis TaxID=5865 RepID=A7AU07_BABBO|nr:Protein phosphatase inhibitor 2 (IPP-2) family protein [Babesia bovis T2Bo]EDO06418.1 Protein phosphatase inhibitor 2 (IPP-2) family protein [Babesia bovis T2Bo]BAN65657.1 conserved hypothetical protein [Babesia bovis]|eukprot:XP_001609986.1 hypothetical protein [Babesia bovis T2Bo]